MKGFWEIENCELEQIKNKENIICEEYFLQNHTTDETGKYIVKMPLKKDPMCLDRSRDIVVSNSLWNKMKVDSDLLDLYKYFLTKYKKMVHMTEIIDNEEQDMYFKSHLDT